MLRPKKKAISLKKLTPNSNANSDIKLINSGINKKMKLIQSQLRLKKSNISTANQKINITQKGQSVQFLQTRKQSMLNSYYNQRKNHLLQVTKQNKKIYERINSQKSNYSSRALNNSYDSVSSMTSRISGRSSKSKISICKKSSRGVSFKNSRFQSQSRKQQKVQPLVKAQNINKVQKQQIINFGKVFFKQVPPKVPLKIQKNTHDENLMTLIKQYPCQQLNRTSLTKISKNGFSSKLNTLTQFTPERPPKMNEKYHKTSIGLPAVKETTPQKKLALQTIIQNLGFKYKL